MPRFEEFLVGFAAGVAVGVLATIRAYRRFGYGGVAWPVLGNDWPWVQAKDLVQDLWERSRINGWFARVVQGEDIGCSGMPEEGP